MRERKRGREALRRESRHLRREERKKGKEMAGKSRGERERERG